MGGSTLANDTAVELGRLVKKLELRLRTLFYQARRASRRIGAAREASCGGGGGSGSRLGVCPLASPRKLFNTLSNKAAPCMLHMMKKASGSGLGKQNSSGAGAAGGVWQREILMGEKCQPLDFSGVIYYDNQGNPTAGIPPRSPRGGASPMLQTFSFQVPLGEKGGY